MKDCVFCKISNGEIEKEFEYQDEDLMVFPDINPSKPVHILIVPRRHIEDFSDLDDMELLGKVKKVADEQVKKHGLSNKGYRLHINGGGAQIVDHVHFHLTGPIEKGFQF